MLLFKKDNYEVHTSERHGKSVVGTKQTSSIQVRKIENEKYYLLLKQFSYPINDAEKRNKAIDKASEFVKQQILNRIQYEKKESIIW